MHFPFQYTFKIEPPDSLEIDESSTVSSSGPPPAKVSKRKGTESPSNAASEGLPTMTPYNNSDINTTFTDHILNELRAIPDADARFLRQRLMRTMIDVLEGFSNRDES